MQTDEQVSQSIPLRFLEDGEEIGAVEEGQSGDVIQRVHKANGGGDQNKRQHQPSPCPVDVAEQAVESQAEADENDRGKQVSDDAKTEKHLVSQDVICRRGGIPAHDQFARNIQETEGRGEYER